MFSCFGSQIPGTVPLWALRSDTVHAWAFAPIPDCDTIGMSSTAPISPPSWCATCGRASAASDDSSASASLGCRC